MATIIQRFSDIATLKRVLSDLIKQTERDFGISLIYPDESIHVYRGIEKVAEETKQEIMSVMQNNGYSKNVITINGIEVFQLIRGKEDETL